MRQLRINVLAVGLIAAAMTGRAADPWIEIRSPHFIVVSNASERATRDVAWQFEQIKTAIENGWPWARVPIDRPVLIIAARNEAAMKTLVPQYWEKDSKFHPATV